MEEKNKRKKSFTLPNFSKERLRNFQTRDFLKKNLGGFTLIELLVVISIVGLLSSIVLVSLRGATDKAKVTKALQFSQNILSALGDEAALMWWFDDCGGGTTVDSSGYGNAGTIVGATCVDDTPHKQAGGGGAKKALQFSGAYVWRASVKNLSTSALTFEFWSKLPAAPTSYAYPIAIFGTTSGLSPAGVYVASNTFEFHAVFVVGANQYTPLIANSSDGKWHHFVVTFDGSTIQPYYDGNSMVPQSAPGTISAGSAGGDNSVFVGARGTAASGPSGNTYFPGTIDEVRIYAKVLKLSEVQEHYLAGRERHQDLTMK